MRLHNRLVKAAFWIDTDLIKLLDIPGRMFYQGLWQLADDSGCLDHDLLAFKIHLFPADEQITLPVIEDWVNKLIGAKKLITYKANGKDCLFLKNFHKHQTLKNCPPPTVPLPDWIKFEPFPSNMRQGKYIVSDDILDSVLQGSYNKTDITDADLQSSSNLNQNLNQNHIKEYKSDSANPTPPEKPLEDKKTKTNPEKPSPQESIYNHWNSKKIIVHRKLDDKTKRKIKAVLKDYSEDEIKTTIDNYDVILKDDKYYWSYRWTLWDLLHKGLETFKDFGVAASNFTRDEHRPRGDPGGLNKSVDFNKYEQHDLSEERLEGLFEEFG
ncbi:MAG TPA: hypothetical protein VFD33_02395 [Bacillota bacterium]|nr:hypothetical protein [Bacillota bacterium]